MFHLTRALCISYYYLLLLLLNVAIFLVVLFFLFSFVETVTFSHLVIIIDTYMQYYIRTIIFWFRNLNLL